MTNSQKSVPDAMRVDDDLDRPLFFEPSGDGMRAYIHDGDGYIFCEANYDDFKDNPSFPERVMKRLVERAAAAPVPPPDGAGEWKKDIDLIRATLDRAVMASRTHLVPSQVTQALHRVEAALSSLPLSDAGAAEPDDVRSALADRIEAAHYIRLVGMDKDIDADEREIILAALRSAPVSAAPPVRGDREALVEADGCFEAALFEGWIDAIENCDIERIRDLWYRRMAYAAAAVRIGLSLPREPGAAVGVTREAWRLAETAPRDGTHILVCRGPYSEHWGFNQSPPAVVHYWQHPAANEAGFYLSNGGTDDDLPFEFTHWQLLGITPNDSRSPAPDATVSGESQRFQDELDAAVAGNAWFEPIAMALPRHPSNEITQKRVGADGNVRMLWYKGILRAAFMLVRDDANFTQLLKFSLASPQDVGRDAAVSEPWPDHPGATLDAVAFVEAVKRYPQVDRDSVTDLSFADKQADRLGAFIEGFKRAVQLRAPTTVSARDAVIADKRS